MTDIAKELGIALGEPIELVALAVKKSAIRCRTLYTHIPITLRKVRWWVEGEILTVRPEKLWRFKNTNYMSGKVESTRIDIPALKLEPLSLLNPWPWDPEEEYWGEEPAPTDKYFEEIKQAGRRTSYEMQQILPFDDPDEPFKDPITIANDLYRSGQFDEAYGWMEKLLVEDIRCLDAHAHLGNWDFNVRGGSRILHHDDGEQTLRGRGEDRGIVTAEGGECSAAVGADQQPAVYEVPARVCAVAMEDGESEGGAAAVGEDAVV